MNINLSFTPKALINTSPGLPQPWGPMLPKIRERWKRWPIAAPPLGELLQSSRVMWRLIPRVAATMGWNWRTPSA